MLQKRTFWVVLWLLADCSAQAFAFNHVVTLGDSLLDDPDGGRSPVAAEHIAERLDVPLTKLAKSGSTSTDLISDGQHTQAAALFGAGDLAMLWIGGNDFFSNPLDVAFGNSDFLDTLESNANTAIETLVENEIEVAVFNLPDMSQVPGVIATVEATTLPFLRSSVYRNITRETIAWNDRLASLATTHGATVINVFNLFDQLAANPSDFSLLGNNPILNADTGCQLCVFYDDFLMPDVHPSSFAQGFIANEAIATLNTRFSELDLNALTSVEIALLADLHPGDFDGNDFVDSNDLLVWQSHFSASGADADGDGDTDGADFLVWQQQLADTSAAVSPNSAPIPEPQTLWLLGICVLMALTAKRQ